MTKNSCSGSHSAFRVWVAYDYKHNFRDFGLHSFEFGILPVKSSCGYIACHDPYGDKSKCFSDKALLSSLLEKTFIDYQTDFDRRHNLQLGLRAHSCILKRFRSKHAENEDQPKNWVNGTKYIYAGVKVGNVNRMNYKSIVESGAFGEIIVHVYYQFTFFKKD